MFIKSLYAVPCLIAFACPSLNAEDPIGTLEGQITDPSSGSVDGADVRVTNPLDWPNARLNPHVPAPSI
jgi:hypothetical protein